jgi:stage II sporulation protein AA (anti-sigma F factor antagonist)
MPDIGELVLHASAHGDTHTVRLEGELDLATVPELVTKVVQLCGARAASEIVLDLGELAFIDSTGLRGVLTCRELCEVHGCELSLLPGGTRVQRVFEIAGLLDALPFHRPASPNGDARPPAAESERQLLP